MNEVTVYNDNGPVGTYIWDHNELSYPVSGDERFITKTREIAEGMPSIIRVEQTSPNSLVYYRAENVTIQEVTEELADKVQKWIDEGGLK